MTLSEILQMREDRKNGVILCRASIDALIEHAVEREKQEFPYGNAYRNAMKRRQLDAISSIDQPEAFEDSFYRLALDYRGATVLHASAAFKKLVAYVDAHTSKAVEAACNATITDTKE